jgi:DNA-binding winged helix-turn-helix (wHTH) protein
MASTAAFRFGPFVLDPAAFRLSYAGGQTTLSPKAIDLLLMFVQEPARLFTKDEIFRVLWPDVAVTDNALTQVVSQLRRVLGERPGEARYLQTVARRGYRFVAPVQVVLESRTPVLRRVPAVARRRHSARTVRVSEFTNVTGDRELAWLSSGIAESLTNGLRGIRELRVIDRSAPSSGWEVPDADLFVVGGFQRIGEQLRITARVVNAVTREAVAHAKADGALSEVFALQDAIAAELSAVLKGAETSGTTGRPPLLGYRRPPISPERQRK